MTIHSQYSHNQQNNLIFFYFFKKYLIRCLENHPKS